MIFAKMNLIAFAHNARKIYFAKKDHNYIQVYKKQKKEIDKRA